MTDSSSAFPGAPTDQAGNFVDWLGLQFVEMTGDEVVCTWTAEARMHQPYGIVHGGIHCSVVETLASLGGAMWLGDKGQVVGVNNNTDFYRAVSVGAMT
jgi:1,4-dihydroxy-2-naphthoyl-CoA hydrolase